MTSTLSFLLLVYWFTYLRYSALSRFRCHHDRCTVCKARISPKCCVGTAPHIPGHVGLKQGYGPRSLLLRSRAARPPLLALFLGTPHFPHVHTTNSECGGPWLQSQLDVVQSETVNAKCVCSACRPLACARHHCSRPCSVIGFQ